MGKSLFWGEQGEYGPFTRQDDGWPNAGEVIRHYRRKRAMSAEELARHYGEAIHFSITARWILKMEQQNKVPADISRRRVLATLLEIPPLLLGLASLETVTPQPPHLEPQAPHVLTFASFDLDWYRKEARVFWQLHYAQAAHETLGDILTYLQTLSDLHQTARGAMHDHLSELMNSYYRLAATIQRDRGHFAQAYRCANEGVRLAKALENTPYAAQLVAASQYTRGVVNFAWGVFGDEIRLGHVIMQHEKIKAALADFSRALAHASPVLKGIIYSEMARAQALLVASPTDVSISLKLLEQAESFLEAESTDDFYAHILLNGDAKGLDKKRLLLGRGRTFLALQRPGKALDEFEDLDLLSASPTHTRRRGWTQLLYAQAAFDLGDYATAAEKALSACRDCLEVQSLPHLARVRELSLKLQTSPAKEHGEVKQLSKLLETVFPRVPSSAPAHHRTPPAETP